MKPAHLFAALAALAASAAVLDSAPASASPPPHENTYPMHLVFNVQGSGRSMQLNAGIAQVAFGKDGQGWSIVVLAAQMDGAPLGIPNYTPKCTIRGDRDDLLPLYDRIYGRLRTGADLICIGQTSAPSNTFVDLHAGQGTISILEQP